MNASNQPQCHFEIARLNYCVWNKMLLVGKAGSMKSNLAVTGPLERVQQWSVHILHINRVFLVAQLCKNWMHWLWLADCVAHSVNTHLLLHSLWGWNSINTIWRSSLIVTTSLIFEWFVKAFCHEFVVITLETFTLAGNKGMRFELSINDVCMSFYNERTVLWESIGRTWFCCGRKTSTRKAVQKKNYLDKLMETYM